MRTRVLLLMTILLNTAFISLAQPRYKLKLLTKIKCPKDGDYRYLCSGNFINEAAVFSNGNLPIAREPLDDGNGVGHHLRGLDLNLCHLVQREYEDSITFDITRQITSLYFRSKTDHTGWSGCSSLCEKTYNWPVNLSQGVLHVYHGDPFGCYWGSTELWIYPERIDVTVPSGETYLPSTDRINVTATPGYPVTVYNWQYNIGGSGWVDFPASTNTASKSSIMVSGYDLMGAAFDNIGDQNIFIRVKAADYYASEPVILRPTIPSPHINSLTPIPNKCFGESNGTIMVQFDRALLPGESLSVLLNDTINNLSSTAPNVTLDAENKYTFPAQFAPGGFKIELLGSYNNVPCYTGDARHVEETGFVSPSAVSFNNSATDVYCYAGADGAITLNATGGVHNYTVGYKKVQDATWQWIPFSAAGQHTITGLNAGVYQLRVADGNNCFTKDANGNEKIQTVIISQPAQPVQVDYRETTNPLAFGYTDGSAMAIIIGGTPVSGNRYNVAWNDSTTGSVVTTVTNTTNPFTTTLEQIGDGTYIVTATDSHYALTAGANTAGCIVRDTLHLHEPPLLIVTVAEHRYVTCKGTTDGALYAKAQGGIEIPVQRYIYQWFRNVNGGWTNIQQSDSIAVNLTEGTYKIIITDKNNISKESDAFILTEPEVLAVNLLSTPVACNGGTNGTASAVISGGTQPYAIAWSNGSTALSVPGLKQGAYLAFVTDVRGCQTQQQVRVNTPNPILINNPVITPPVCTGYCNGAISYAVSGGIPPYNYQWSNGSKGQNVSGICTGNYSVTISDTRGCTTLESFAVNDPLPLTIELGPHRILCTGQVWLANAAIADPNAVYRWSGPNGFKAATASASLTDEGKYEVLVTDSKGCKGGDNMTIGRSNATVAAEFVSSTQGFKGEKITFVNISQPWPETITWLLLAGNAITVIRRTDTLVELQFNETGNYRIGMRSGVGSCSNEYYNSITILQGQSFNDPGTTTDPFVLDFKVAPNPSNGQFTVTVGLQDVADINLRLINLQNGDVLDQRRQSGGKNYTVPYNVSLVSGVYALVLETAKDSRIFRVLIL
jgi:SprB-like repeat protein